MVKNKLQFAVVREDPQIESELVTTFKLSSAVLIGSGGCTALSLRVLHPTLKIELIEPNPVQIALIKKKISILKKQSLPEARKIIATEKFDTLIESGNFESLFRMLRTFIFEFVIEQKHFIQFFEQGKAISWKDVFQNPYWAAAFELFFSNSLLVSMFGPDAIQYAKPGSYPRYFRELIERGLQRQDARSNYFLQHIFLGRYLSRAENLPDYLKKRIVDFQFKFNQMFAHEFNNYGKCGLVSLSNILDWSNPHTLTAIGERVSADMRAGSVLLFRQLNNDTDFKAFFKGFDWKNELGKKLLKNDRSLFYSDICVGVKR